MNEGGIWNRSKKGQYGKVIFIVTKKVRTRRMEGEGWRRKSYGNFRTSSSSATTNITLTIKELLKPKFSKYSLKCLKNVYQ